MESVLALKKLWPLPLLAQQGPSSGSDIWGQECQFEAGLAHLVLAPSGRGKSTFLHTIYGLRHDYKGEIQLFGKNLREQDAEQWSKWRQQQLAIVFQDLRLFPQLSVWENLQLQMDLSAALEENEVRELLQQLGMEAFVDQKVALLSLGQQQRVSLVRALLQPFDLLLLDEPFSHLDQANIKIAQQAIEAARRREGASLIFISLGDEYGISFDQHWQL